MRAHRARVLRLRVRFAASPSWGGRLGGRIAENLQRVRGSWVGVSAVGARAMAEARPGVHDVVSRGCGRYVASAKATSRGCSNMRIGAFTWVWVSAKALCTDRPRASMP